MPIGLTPSDPRGERGGPGRGPLPTANCVFRSQPDRRKMAWSAARHPVALFYNGIGDHILAIPAVRALAAHFGGNLQLVCAPEAPDLYFHDVPLQATHKVPFTRGADGRPVFDAGSVAAAVGDCDCFLSLVPWHSRSLDELLDRWSPQVSMGFDPAFHTALPIDFDKHSADLTFDLVRSVDPTLELTQFAAPMAIRQAEGNTAAALASILPRSARILIVHADSKREKQWPREKFIRVLDSFLSRHRNFYALVQGTNALDLDEGRHARRVVPCGGLGLGAAFALTASADVFLGIDSCILHVADLCRTPGVGLFGATSSREWGFRFAAHRHVDCGPSMQDAHEDTVLAALESLYTETAGSRPRRFAVA